MLAGLSVVVGQIRTEKGLTQREVAKQAKISLLWLQRLEINQLHTNYQIRRLDQVARALEVELYELRTRTAQGKLTGWILGLLPVVMLILINLMSPGYSHILFHDPTGQKLLYAGAAFIVVGGLVIRKIVDVRV